MRSSVHVDISSIDRAVQHGPLRICFEPRGIGGEINHLAVRRHGMRIRQEPWRRVLLCSSDPLISDFPSLRLGFQFPIGLDQDDSATTCQEIFEPPAKLRTVEKLFTLHCPIVGGVAAYKER